jgi:hypothetical protein
LSDAPAKIGAAGLMPAVKRKRGALANGDQDLIVDQPRIVDHVLKATRRNSHSRYIAIIGWRFSGSAKPALRRDFSDFWRVAAEIPSSVCRKHLLVAVADHTRDRMHTVYRSPFTVATANYTAAASSRFSLGASAPLGLVCLKVNWVLGLYGIKLDLLDVSDDNRDLWHRRNTLT